MSLGFYTDTHIPKQVAIQLRNQGIEVIRCEEVNLAEAEDHVHLQYAIDHQLCLITKDDDFLRLHTEVLENDDMHYGIFYNKHRENSAIGEIVKTCSEYYDLIEADAGDESDLYNTVVFI